MLVAGTITTGLLIWLVALHFNRQGIRRHDGSGHTSAGIVVFVEPVRWLFWVWGFNSFCRGLRRANGRQMVRLFRWSSLAGSLLAVPDLVHRPRLERRAGRLAHLLDQLAADYPSSPIHLVGYSTGGYIALEAAKKVSSPERISGLVLLAATASPRYAWQNLERRIAAIHSFYSSLDLINLLGPSLFGSNDRRWGPSCGAIGFRSAPPIVRQRSWSPADVRLGYLGGHFTIVAPAFVAAHVTPLLS